MPGHILVVDDDSNVSANIKELLETVGYSVVIANCSEQALQSAAEFNPDLVLMDINLGPGADGIETAKKLNATFPRSLIYLGGSDDDTSLKRAQETGPLSYILKPFEPRQLLSAVKMGIHHQRAHAHSSAAESAKRSSMPAPEKPPAEAATQDALTGLATRSVACAYMLDAIQAGKSVCATVFVVDHYAYTRNRYGRQVAEEIISLYGVHLAQYLPPGSALFRWDGPAFLAVVVESDLNMARYARTKITRMTRPPTPYYLQQQSRTALIPIGAHWSTYFSSPQEKPTEIADKIECFVAAHCPH